MHAVLFVWAHFSSVMILKIAHQQHQQGYLCIPNEVATPCWLEISCHYDIETSKIDYFVQNNQYHTLRYSLYYTKFSI